MSGKAFFNRVKAVLGDRVFWFCLVTAAAVLAVCTKSSFLYPMNDWVDANCFYTMGKSMVHGKVLYRDLYEQKGPLLYMIHAVGYLISRDSFFGVYLLESLAAGVFLYSVYCMLREECRAAAVILLPVLAALVYSSASFSHGDSAEEFCLPMLAVCVSISVNALKKGHEVSPAGFFAAGAMGACVLWIKYTMLGFFVGWFLVPAVTELRKGGFRRLVRSIGWVVAGVAVVSLPILLYFAANEAVGDLFQVYFHDNMFLYAETDVSGAASFWGKISTIASTVWNYTRSTLRANPRYAVLIVAGLVWALLLEKASVKFHVVLMMLLTCLSVYGGGRGYPYYGFILAAFSVFGLLPVCRLASHLPQNRTIVRGAAAVGTILAVILSCQLSGNTYLMLYPKEEMPQYKFASVIRKKENATLLNYGFLDGGFYTASGIVPNTRFFCTLNIPLPEMMETQNRVVEEGGVDFVVTRMALLQSDRYELAAQASMYFEGGVRDYYLYQLKE